MKGTKERIFIVTNETSRYSFLLRLAPGDIDGLLVNFYMKIKGVLRLHGWDRIPNARVYIITLSGSAPSLTSFQNQQLYCLSNIVDRGDYTYLEDMEERINQTPTTIGGKMKWVADEFKKLLEEDPPSFTHEEPPPDNVIPFMN